MTTSPGVTGPSPSTGPSESTGSEPARGGCQAPQIDGVHHADLLGPLALEAERHADLGETALRELAHGVLLAGGQHVVAGLVLLQHPVHAAHVVPGVSPVAL